MSDVFGPEYAAAYDLFYAEKDYVEECNAIEQAFTQFSSQPVRRVLDMGCGTGGHTVPLALRGYEVVGIDRSPAMLRAAVAKAQASDVADRINWLPGDISIPIAGAPFDAVLMMFNVLGYQTSPTELAAALVAVRRALRDDGLFLFDVWDAASIERDPPVMREHVHEHDGERLIRLSSGELDRHTELCSVAIRVRRYSADQLLSETFERHIVRYFRRETIDELLEGAGMKLIRLGRFPEYWLDPDSHRWSVFGIARKLKSNSPRE